MRVFIPSFESSRLEYIDLAKGLCISLVVCFHIFVHYNCITAIDNAVRTIMMPFFFFISGFFFNSYDCFATFFRKKTNRLLIPFVFFYIISVVMMIIMNKYSLCESLGQFIFNEDFSNVSIWFLFCLFEVNILFYCVIKIFGELRYSKTIIIIVSWLFGIIGLALSLLKINLWAFLDTAFSVMPFFGIGWLLGHDKRRFHDFFTLPRAVSMIVTSCLVLLLFSSYVDYRSNYFSNLSYYTAYLCGFAGIFLLLSLACIVKRIPIITYFGRYSIIVLCTHRIIYQSIGALLNFFDISFPFTLIINVMGTILMELIIIPFCISFLPHLTAQKELLL